jgi:hypothetical protein
MQDSRTKKACTMSTPAQTPRALLEKIQSLPAERIADVEDLVDFLKDRAANNRPALRKPLDFPLRSMGKWPEDLSLRRANEYGDEARYFGAR